MSWGLQNMRWYGMRGYMLLLLLKSEMDGFG